MNDHVLSFCGTRLHARPDGALWWPDARLLCVSDLHLGKSERIARRGGTMLPPYESRETLWRLEQAVAQTDPATVVCLGDSFDDLGAAHSLDADTRATLAGLQAGRRWVWIEGNHDPGPVDLGGSHLQTLVQGNLTFQHIAGPAPTGEISGHYHPKAGLPGTGTRPCFVVDETRLMLPAFGAYTGGLSLRDPALNGLFSNKAIAVLTGRKATPVPLSACLKR